MSTTVARRFPADLGYRTRADIPTITDLTSAALAAYGRGAIAADGLAVIMSDLMAYADRDSWNALTPARRAVLMADVMGHNADLTHLERRLRAEGIAR